MGEVRPVTTLTAPHSPVMIQLLFTHKKNFNMEYHVYCLVNSVTNPFCRMHLIV